MTDNPFGGAGGFDMNALLEQAQAVQAQLMEAQQQLAARQFDARKLLSRRPIGDFDRDVLQVLREGRRQLGQGGFDVSTEFVFAQPVRHELNYSQ